MMKRIVSMLLFTGTLLIGNTVFSFYADESSAVNLGMVQSYSRSAINVIDDDGTAYTFVYDNRPHSDLGFGNLKAKTSGINGNSACNNNLTWNNWLAVVSMR